MSEYTKGEWITTRRADGFDFNDYDIRGRDVNSVWLARCFGNKAEANARRICQCVNSHDALLAACEDVQLELELLLGLAKLEPDKELRSRKITVVKNRIEQVTQAIAEVEK